VRAPHPDDAELAVILDRYEQLGAEQYVATSLVKIRIQVVPGSDPPVPFVVTAFPSGLL
jgi:hypothetical protein